MFSNISLLKERLKIDDMTGHSVMMVFFGLLAGFFNYIYQLAMGIMLTPDQYSTLFSLISISMIIAILTQTLQTSSAKYTSKFKIQGSTGMINYLWRFSVKRAFLLGFALFLLFSLLTPLLARFLNTDNNWYFIVLFSSLIFGFTLPVNMGVLQGMQRFMALGFGGALLAFLKFSIGVLLVFLGLGINGGLLPLLISSVLVFIVTNLLIKDIIRARSEKTELSGIFSYTGLTFLAILSFAIISNIDVILVRHYLSSDDAGTYSAISVLGRIAFYAPAGVVLAMFPKASDLFESGGNHFLVIKKATLFTLLIGGIILLFYCLVSDFIVESIFGDKYSMAGPYLFKYGLAMLLFACSFLFLNYFLSLNQTKVAYPLLVTVLLQIVLILFFHSSISQIVNIMLICGFASVIFQLPFYLKGGKCSQS